MRLLLAVAVTLLVPDLALGAGAGAPPSRAAASEGRVLAVIPFYGPERMWQLYAPVAEFLTRETGERWELKLYASHEATLDAVCAGETDVALLGPVPLARANQRCGALPFLVARGRDGSATYRSVLLTADPHVARLEDLRGKKIGFFQGSTAAHVVPMRLLREAGLGPGSFEPVFLESQDRLVAALLAHQISGAGVKEALFRRLRQDPVRPIATSEPLPNFAFCALPAQDSARRARFVRALLRVRPGQSTADAEAVKGWDDEIKNGFAEPQPDFLPAVLRLLAAYESVVHESP